MLSYSYLICGYTTPCSSPKPTPFFCFHALRYVCLIGKRWCFYAFPAFRSFLRCRSTPFPHGNRPAVIDKQAVQFTDQLGVFVVPQQRHPTQFEFLHNQRFWQNKIKNPCEVQSVLSCTRQYKFVTSPVLRVGPATYCLHKAKQAVACTTKVRKNSARCNADRYLAHFLKMGCKARKPCGWIPGTYFQRDQSCDRTPTCILATKPLLRSIIGNILAVGLTLQSNMKARLRQKLRFALVARSKSSINARFACFSITCFNDYGRIG